jgi:hypothetical protein
MLEEAIESHEIQLETLRLAVATIEGSLGEIATRQSLPTGLALALSEVEIPMKGEKSLDGIISYLAAKHAGNVHERGIVTVTSKSVRDHDEPNYAVTNVADIASTSRFLSGEEPGQWVCWDFREMRIRPTHYTIHGWNVRSCVVEGSLDGESWTEIDRQTDREDFLRLNTASFAVSSPAEFRFIRLTQTDTNATYGDALELCAVEFFGVLFESLSSRICAIEKQLQMTPLRLQIRMKEAKSLDGIISYLTAKHGGNVHEKGIVTISSKSTEDETDVPQNIADRDSGTRFSSKDEPGQWVCWDFRKMRVGLTGYTILGWSLKSWIVEGSEDGRIWTEIDRQRDDQDFKRSDWRTTASFVVPNPTTFRFIRLTQTDKSHDGDDELALVTVEFFGELSE